MDIANKLQWALVLAACVIASDSSAAPNVPVPQATSLPPPPRPKVPVAPPRLTGWVDLHTHPLSNVGFGGKLLYGGVDIGALLPSDPSCNHSVRATSVEHALGHDKSTHGGWDAFSNTCGDALRAQFIHQFQGLNRANDPGDDASGYPTFSDWPKWDDITHQKMWVEWIRRAHVGGLRVMVALAVNNKTTADAVAGPGDYATDDKTSADLQLVEIKSFVGRHSDFMEIAYSSADLYRIVSANKLAVVLGIEVDNLGNMHRIPGLTQAAISAEIGRLYGEGVRYIFPIHVIDNPLGGTAVYEDVFNLSNRRETGHYWALACAPPNDGIEYIHKPAGFDPLTSGFAGAKLGMILGPSDRAPVPSGCSGMVNSRGLSTLGIFAIKEMMRRGMLIDIDHMSQASANGAIDIADHVPGGFYPLNSGHNGLRCASPGQACNERAFTAAQYGKIGKFHGMAGIGSAGEKAFQWTQMYLAVTQAMGSSGVGGFGTDTNGFAMGMPSSTSSGAVVNSPAYNACTAAVHAANPCGTLATAAKPACARQVAIGDADCKTRFPAAWKCLQNCDHPLPPVQYGSAFPMSTLGNRSWDYNAVGVAHYGMLPDFLQAVRSAPGGASMIDNNLMHGADYFFETWKLSEAQSAKVGN